MEPPIDLRPGSQALTSAEAQVTPSRAQERRNDVKDFIVLGCFVLVLLNLLVMAWTHKDDPSNAQTYFLLTYLFAALVGLVTIILGRRSNRN